MEGARSQLETGTSMYKDLHKVAQSLPAKPEAKNDSYDVRIDQLFVRKGQKRTL